MPCMAEHVEELADSDKNLAVSDKKLADYVKTNSFDRV